MSAFAELHDELRSVAREVLGKEVDEPVRWAQITDAGWLGLEVPEALDGSGATLAETAVVLEELGRAATSAPFLGAAVLGVGALLAVEATARRDDLLRAVAAGARVAVALGPPDAAEPAPLFHLDASGRLSGTADLVLDAPGAGHLLLLAETPAGTLVLAHLHPPLGSGGPDRLEDVDRGHQNGVHGVQGVVVEAASVVDATRSFGSVVADGITVPAEDVWPIDPAAARAVLDRAALAVAADGLGVAAAMLDATVAYVGVRRQFDRTIGSFQAVKHQCADALVAIRLGRQLLGDAVSATVAGDAGAPVAVSRAKAHLGQAAVDVVGTAMQLHGGIGYTWESGIHRYLKRALLDRSLFGSPAAHRRRIAAHRWPTLG